MTARGEQVAAGPGGQQQQNRYAHLVKGGNGTSAASQMTSSVVSPSSIKAQVSVTSTLNENAQHEHKTAPHPVSGQQQQQQQQQRRAYANNYYNSFSTVDWKEQWYIMKDKILERVEEPQNQRKLILFIVCCALLLDNMLYMVIVPIIPDYLRSIGAWSTYTENAKWIRRNVTGSAQPKWERVGGNVVYEGEDSAVGFLFASKAIVQLFINPFSGAIIDRIGYEIPMMIGLTVMFFSTMVFACGQTYSVLFLARSLQGVGSAFADTSGLAMIADRFTEENERQRALGVALAFISFGCLVAPPFGSVLYQGAGKEVPFIILSLVCLLDGSLLLLVTPPGTFAQLLPAIGRQTSYSPNQQPQVAVGSSRPAESKTINPPAAGDEAEAQQHAHAKALKRQKSISRRQSMTAASAGEAPKGTPIYVLFRDPCIACCSGALVVANVSLAFLEPTISIWVQNTMPDIEEWQMGMIWLPAFVPHVFGVYCTVKLADKYPRYQWLIAAIGLILEGLSCLMVPFCSSFWSLIIPISIICFGLALIDTAILPTLGFLVDTRYVSVYGSIYAIADISYSLSYAIGPIIAGGIVEAIGFTALNFLIAIVTLGYTPILMMLRAIHDYEPFEADNTGMRKKKAKELALFGQYQKRSDAIDEEAEEEDETAEEATSGNEQLAKTSPAEPVAGRYESPRWADRPAAAEPEARRPVLIKKASIVRNNTKWSSDESSSSSAPTERHSVRIVEDPAALSGRHYETRSQPDESRSQPSVRNPFL